MLVLLKSFSRRRLLLMFGGLLACIGLVIGIGTAADHSGDSLAHHVPKPSPNASAIVPVPQTYETQISACLASPGVIASEIGATAPLTEHPGYGPLKGRSCHYEGTGNAVINLAIGDKGSFKLYDYTASFADYRQELSSAQISRLYGVNRAFFSLDGRGRPRDLIMSLPDSGAVIVIDLIFPVISTDVATRTTAFLTVGSIAATSYQEQWSHRSIAV